MRPWLRWTLLGIAGAALVHVATVRLLSRIVMGIATAGMARVAGFNAAVYPPRADATSRAIVRPSPDLLYAGCAFDVRQHPLHIRAEVPRDTYWSLSMFAANTDNFFVLNDKGVGGKKTARVIFTREGGYKDPQGGDVVQVPSDKGIIIFRLLVLDRENVAALRKIQQAAKCEPL